MKEGKLKEAVGVLLEVLGREPGNERAFKFILEIDELVGEPEFSQEVWEKLAGLCPADFAVLTKAGVSFPMRAWSSISATGKRPRKTGRWPTP